MRVRPLQLEKFWNWFQRKTKHFLDDPAQYCEEIDCKSYFTSPSLIFCPLTNLSPYFAKTKFTAKVHIMSAFSYWELCYATVEFSQDFFFPSQTLLPDRFGNSFVSDVDIIAYNNENSQKFFIFHFPLKHTQPFSPPGRSFWVRKCLCTCYKDNYHVNKIINLKSFSVFPFE